MRARRFRRGFTSSKALIKLTALAAVILSCGPMCTAGGSAPGDATPSSPGGDAQLPQSESQPPPSQPDVSATLAKHGFVVAPGSFRFLDMSACCDKTCAGNNPSSPYGAFFVPPAPGQTAADENLQPDGTTPTFRLRADEAIVFVGQTPPEVRYFGFTPYLNDRANNLGGRRIIAASLSETLNNLVIGVDAPSGSNVFGKRTAIIAAADAGTVQSVRDGLTEAGIPASAINTLTFDPALSHFGLDASADTFGVLFRMAVPKDPAQRDAYMKSPGASLFRLTPSVSSSAKPLASPTARPKDTSYTEAALASEVDALEAAIKAAYPTYKAQSLSVSAGTTDPLACIAGTSVCAYDNRDTTYPSILPRVLFPNDDDFYVVYGVDHQISQKVSYANFSIYAVQHLVGLTSIPSEKYPGSAQRYLPADPAASKLYAWKVARSCGGETHCLQVPKGSCPTGIDNLRLGTITFRTYLEPSSKTAPSASTLVRDRVLRFSRF